MWGDKSCRLEIRLTQEQYEMIAKRSRTTGKSKADVIRTMIDECLRECPNSGQKNNEGVGVEADDTPVKR